MRSSRIGAPNGRPTPVAMPPPRPPALALRRGGGHGAQPGAHGAGLLGRHVARAGEAEPGGELLGPHLDAQAHGPGAVHVAPRSSHRTAAPAPLPMEGEPRGRPLWAFGQKGNEAPRRWGSNGSDYQVGLVT